MAAVVPLEPRATEETLERIHVNLIDVAPDNPRRDVGDVTELAQSIQAVGVIEPLIVTPRGGRYLLVAGARRYAAARQAGERVVPVIVRDLDENQRLLAMTIENLQRVDLTPLEEASAYRNLVELGLTQRDLAKRVGRSQAHISKRLTLLEIPKPAQAALDDGGITLEDALELAKFRDDPKRAMHAWKQRGQNHRGLAGAVEDELDFKQRDELIAAEEAKLEKKGVRLVRFSKPASRYDIPRLPKNAIEIRKGGGYDALRIDPAVHAKEPCHAVAVRVHGKFGTNKQVELIHVCTDRKRHPKAKTGDEAWKSRSSRASSQSVEHREVEKARGPRREFASTLAQKKLPKDEHAKLVLDTLIASAHAEVLKVACRMLLPGRGTGNGFRDFGDTLRGYASTPAKQLHVEAAIAFATHEEHLGIYYAWDTHAPYLQLLEKHGYKLHPIEAKKIGRKTAKKKAD